MVRKPVRPAPAGPRPRAHRRWPRPAGSVAVAAAATSLLLALAHAAPDPLPPPAPSTSSTRSTAPAPPVDLPAYDEAVVQAAWAQLDQAIEDACAWPGTLGEGAPLACAEGMLDRAIADAEAFRSAVTDDARIIFLIGLAHRHAGLLDVARRLQRAAVRADPSRAEAWYELGELAAIAGDHADAADAFDRVTRLRPTAWPAWFARAQAAAFLGQPAPMESALREALRHGFSFQQVAGDGSWQRFARDPTLGPTLGDLLTLFAGPEVRAQLLGQPPATSATTPAPPAPAPR